MNHIQQNFPLCFGPKKTLAPSKQALQKSKYEKLYEKHRGHQTVKVFPSLCLSGHRFTQPQAEPNRSKFSVLPRAINSLNCNRWFAPSPPTFWEMQFCSICGSCCDLPSTVCLLLFIVNMFCSYARLHTQLVLTWPQTWISWVELLNECNAESCCVCVTWSKLNYCLHVIWLWATFFVRTGYYKYYYHLVHLNMTFKWIQRIFLWISTNTNTHCLTTAGGRVQERALGGGAQRVAVTANRIYLPHVSFTC